MLRRMCVYGKGTGTEQQGQGHNLCNDGDLAAEFVEVIASGSASVTVPAWLGMSLRVGAWACVLRCVCACEGMSRPCVRAAGYVHGKGCPDARAAGRSHRAYCTCTLYARLCMCRVGILVGHIRFPEALRFLSPACPSSPSCGWISRSQQC
eukprot:340729-Chlamydomonas_euryale.AAC.1